jgi:carbamoylphosphate synthase small subunit
LIVDDLCANPSHWSLRQTLSDWLSDNGVPAIRGIDTRALTQKIREHGTMLGKIIMEHAEEHNVPWVDPAKMNLVAEVSIKVRVLLERNCA